MCASNECKTTNNSLSRCVVPLQSPGESMPPPSRTERAARYVPVLGWLIANELEKRRRLPVWKSAINELQNRGMGSHPSEGVPPVGSIQLFIAQSIQMHLGWPNALFVGEDSFDAMLIGDDGEGIEILHDIEGYLTLSEGTFTDSDLCKMRSMTFQDALSYVAKVAKERRRT